MGGDSDQQTFSRSESLGQPAPTRMHFDGCIISTDKYDKASSVLIKLVKKINFYHFIVK